MDTASVLMGLGLLILFIAPVGYLVYNQSSKTKKRAQKMTLLALEEGYTLNDSETLKNYSLGIDNSAQKFLVLRNWKNEKLQSYNFQEIQAVTLVKVNEDSTPVSALDEVRIIALNIKFKDGKEEKVTFYTSEENAVTQKSEFLEKAVKWEKMLKAIIVK